MAVTPEVADKPRRRHLRPLRYIKRFLPRTLLGRSLLIIVSPIILLQVIITYTFYDSHWDIVIRRLSSGLAGDIAMVIDSVRDVQSEEQRRDIFHLARLNMDIQLQHTPGAILPNIAPPKGNRLLDEWLRNALTERLNRPFHIDWDSDRRRVFIDVQLHDGILHVSAPRERLFSSRTYVFILWMVGTSLILFAVAMIFMRNQVRPLRRLAQAADGFGKGRDVPDFKPEGAAEVRQAAAAFSLMRARIRRQITQRTEMLAGVSHDLRTPLTRMKLQLAMLGDSPEVGDMKADVAEMERMVDGYLAFARGEGREEPVPTDLLELIGEAAGNARRQGAEIDLHVEGEITLPLRPNAFGRCLDNLITNARRYGGHVWITAVTRRDTVQITVEDDGPGISEEMREEVFKPFFRLDASRNPETGGVGLGLSIARDVVRRHGGEITLDKSAHGGLKVLIRLPM